MVIRGSGWSYRGVGVNLGKRVYLLLRDSPDEAVLGLKMEDEVEIGGDTTILGITHLATQWFPVNLSEHCWLFDTDELVGRIGELTVEGGSLKSLDDARVDVTFEVFDRYGQVSNRLLARSRATIDSSLSFGDFNVTSEIRGVEGNELRVWERESGSKIVATTDSLSSGDCSN